MAAERKFVRVRENGQLTLPVESRRRLGLEEGDLVAVSETPDGVLLEPRRVAALRALDELGTILRQEGVSLDDLIASGRAIRGELLEEEYGINGADDPT